ncbi:uncharacterized protein Z519_05615 [Cladophialophora bantiana CBS 173.52]|uniref:Uncharacterized protein n=1 Tax=Cladophialophora bantiana (strain ATCC 10958 / CBS 173.52 / CDC B-1940 / NIH 8579) TaxID=1442370 RepID=A0A0D2IBX0_CLAB1|nr:uncharacterized protein Z519_05615 [Cladophialophora bantiana CBS 173.52]KIW94299.1 hypothetical protein Z519_05615 [Cladophialophora bantiana CBS 173.52]
MDPNAMTDDPNPFGPQPNLIVLADSIQATANEAKKLQNLPVFRDGNAIIAAIQNLGQQFNTQFNTLNRRFDQFEIKLDGLQTQMRASEINNLARIQNSYLSTSASPITPLVNILTAAEVPGFPAMSRHVARVEEPELETVLQALGLAPATGSVAAKRRQLRGLVGLAERPENA